MLLNAEGTSVNELAIILKRSYFTVRKWLLNFKAKGVAGLDRSYSPGRPAAIKNELLPYLDVWLAEPPGKYGFMQNCWTVKLIIKMFENKTGKRISEDTVERSLKSAGFSYKRPKKSVPVTAPAREEKLKKVNSLIEEISASLSQEDVEVFAVDESHFSTEPYIIKGWFKKGEFFFPAHSPKKTKLHNIWRIKLKDTVFLLEKIR